jgi:glycerophosphoryl diester phosphodiesterase
MPRNLEGVQALDARQDAGVAPPPRPARHLPIGFAHRGARAECRDNTIPAFRRALELGARGIESDAWATADGVVVLDHDGIVRRGLRRIGLRTLRRDELPTHMPSLSDLLAICGPDVDLSLDVRDPATAEATIDLVDGNGWPERTWLCGGVAQVVAWRRRSNRIRLVNSTRLADIPEGLPARLVTLAAAGIDAVNLRWPEWDPERLRLVHGAGLLAFAWDTQRADTITRMARMGLDGVYSDHVARMVEALAAAHRPSD